MQVYKSYFSIASPPDGRGIDGKTQECFVWRCLIVLMIMTLANSMPPNNQLDGQKSTALPTGVEVFFTVGVAVGRGVVEAVVDVAVGVLGSAPVTEINCSFTR